MSAAKKVSLDELFPNLLRDEEPTPRGPQVGPQVIEIHIEYKQVPKKLPLHREDALLGKAIGQFESLLMGVRAGREVDAQKLGDICAALARVAASRQLKTVRARELPARRVHSRARG